MTKGTFGIISESYRKGAENLFEYCRNAPIILRPFFYLYAIIYYIILHLISFIFYILSVFDFLAENTDYVRKGILKEIEYKSDNVKKSLGSFIFNPLIITILVLLFVLSALIPKISSLMDMDDITGELRNGVEDTGISTFKAIITFSMKTTSNLFAFIQPKHAVSWPFLIIPCLSNSTLMLLLIAVSTPLLLFDFFSYIIDSIRCLCIRISMGLEKSTVNGFGGFIFTPLILIILFPIFLAVLIIPKFSTGIDFAA